MGCDGQGAAAAPTRFPGAAEPIAPTTVRIVFPTDGYKCCRCRPLAVEGPLGLW